MDDESAATEMANDQPNAGPSDDDWNAIIDVLWAQYDVDQSGYIDKEEIEPLAQAALSQVGFTEELDKEVLTSFFAEVDSDGNGQIDKDELLRFMKSIM